MASIAFWLAGMLAVASLGAMLARLGWPFELFCHFRAHFAVGGLAIALLCAATGVWFLAAASMAIAMWAMFGLMSGPVAAIDEAMAGHTGVTIVWANVWKKQGALGRTVTWASANRADVILLGEFPPAHAIGDGFAGYPYRLDTGINDGKAFATRIAVLSRLPLLEGEIIAPIGRHDRPFLCFAIEVEPGRRLAVLAVHPDAPMSPLMQRDRDQMIRRLEGLAQAPYLIAGDFNATPWCPAFARIPGKRIGPAARRPTWLTSIPLFGLPIDHIKVSPDVRASAYKVAPFLGSDHRAILARVHVEASIEPPIHPA